MERYNPLSSLNKANLKKKFCKIVLSNLIDILAILRMFLRDLC